MALVQVQSGELAILRCPLAGLLALFPGLLSLLLSRCHRVAFSLYLPTQSQASYRNVSSSLSARRPSSCKEKADAREDVVVVDGHADVRASAAMTDNNDNDADDGDFDGNLGASSMATPSLDLDLARGAVNSNVDLARTHLLVTPSHLPPPLPSPPSSAAPGEPF